MSDTIVAELAPKLVADKKLRPRKPRINEITEFKTWLNGLGFQSAPKLHINGVQHATAVTVVDFGTPLAEPVKLTTEQSADLIGFIRSITKSLYNSDIVVRVQSDTTTGVWWASVG
jgi:hypothetical protein